MFQVYAKDIQVGVWCSQFAHPYTGAGFVTDVKVSRDGFARRITVALESGGALVMVCDKWDTFTTSTRRARRSTSNALVAWLQVGDEFDGARVVGIHAVERGIFGFARVALELSDTRVVVRPVKSLVSAR